MEEETRQILLTAPLEDAQYPQNLAEAIGQRFAELGGVDELSIAPRESMGKPPQIER